MNFSKYQGTGNDFILIDNRKDGFQGSPASIAHLCDRRFGIGADGLILLELPKTDEAIDFKMVYFNADGRESTMCGNGGRCIAKFAQSLGLIKTHARFCAIDGAHEALIDQNGTVSLKMGDVEEARKMDDAYVIDSGSPHYIRFVEAVSEVDVEDEGARIRYGETFGEEGVNVNFVEVGSEKHRIRTYERGVEAETLSCGTGAVAAAIAISLAEESEQTEIRLETQGGALQVRFQRTKNKFHDIWLTGPAERVFDGKIEIKQEQ